MRSAQQLNRMLVGWARAAAFATVASLAALAGSALSPGVASAQVKTELEDEVAPEDANALAAEAITEALEHIEQKRYAKALEALKQAHQRCRKLSCAPEIEAELFSAMGIAHGLEGDLLTAQTRFEWALARKRDVKPDERYMTKVLEQLFADAKFRDESGQGAQPPGPVGVISPEHKAMIDAAQAQLDAADAGACLGTMTADLAGGEYAEGKLMLARCNDGLNLLLEAQREAKSALDLARKDGNDVLAEEIEKYLETLDGEIPRIRLKVPANVREVVVTVDNNPLSGDSYKQPIPHNPGKAVVRVDGKAGQGDFLFEKEITFERRETIDVEAVSEPPFNVCMRKARNVKEQERCKLVFGEKGQGLNIKAGLEVASYNDTNHVDILSPGIYFAAVQPTQGWNVSASAIVDVVTTASADIIATASRRFDEVRVAGAVGGGYKIKDTPVTVGLNGGFSVEPDYVGRSIGANVTADVFEKMATPYLSYSLGLDMLGRADTDFDIFHRDLYRHTVNAGSSIIIDSSTVAVVGATFEAELGDNSKPYRHVPMFHPSIAANVPAGAAPAFVALGRLPLDPLEQLPDERYRYAVLVGAMHRFDDATLRGWERVYTDSWGQTASTTDVRYLWDFYTPKEADGFDGFPQLRFTPHLRFHIQGPVDFWQRAYVAGMSVRGYDIPRYRSTDRELGPMWSLTGGLGLRAALSRIVAVAVQVEGTYSQFLDHLYIYDRFGLFTASTLELEFE